MSDYEAFKEAILAVRENKDINDGKWSDWEEGAEILIFYEINTTERVARLLDCVLLFKDPDHFIDCALDSLCLEEYGVIMSPHT